MIPNRTSLSSTVAVRNNCNNNNDIMQQHAEMCRQGPVTAVTAESRKARAASAGWCGYLKAVGGALASHRLLTHTSHHLGNVDGRALAATLTHVQGAVVPVQSVHAHLHAHYRHQEKK